MEAKEQIVLTPKGKTSNSTKLWIERKVVENTEPGDKIHVAGGDHVGIIINKETKDDEKVISQAHLSLEFRVYLVNAQTGVQTQEIRTLRFWFRHVFEPEAEEASMAQEFFRGLIQPKEFPRDYVGFIKKIMKLLQHGFQRIVRIELILSQVEASEIPELPSSSDDSENVDLSEEKVLEIVELYYPNPINVQELCREYDWDENDVTYVLRALEYKGVIRSMLPEGYTRVVQNDADVKVVKQMPKIVSSHQPTIAIITAQFTEKLAVDAMMENKETFVRYTTVGSDSDGPRKRFGESNIYTLGNIGEHRIVCTKLPSIGHTREAMIAAGNTTTRLLGTFQNVDHVVLVGTGGGVPHFTNYNRHVRLGDVVISHAPSNAQSIFVHCEGATEVVSEMYEFDVKEYLSKNPTLQNVAAQIKVDASIGGGEKVWKYIEEGLRELEAESEHDFHRPSEDSDKIYMTIGERELIEVSHPRPQENESKRTKGRPRLHLGVTGAGRDIARSDHLRQKFSQKYQILAFVSEFGPVIESVIGNCRDSFIFVRGITDYKDGTKKTEWQPYAALAAASVTKAIISALDTRHGDSSD